MVFKGKNGKEYVLKNRAFTQNSESQFFEIDNYPELVAVIYKLGKFSSECEKELEQKAYTLDLLYDKGTFLGYVMKKDKQKEEVNDTFEYNDYSNASFDYTIPDFTSSIGEDYVSYATETEPSYVAVSNAVSAGNYKRGNFKKKVLIWIVAAVAIVALAVFVIWPFVIKPNLSNSDLYTPAIIKSYSFTDEKKDRDDVLTITECSKDGNVIASWIIMYKDQFAKINLQGKIVEKQNNGDVVIKWNTQTPEILPDEIKWEKIAETTIENDAKKAITADISMLGGANKKTDIRTPADFQKLANSNGLYILQNDIDLSGMKWSPIENFAGVFVCNGHSVKNLTIETDSSNVGLFAVLKGMVSDLKLENVNIVVSGRNKNIGALCGEYKAYKINLSGISVSGSIKASKSEYVGGLIGCINTTASVNIKDVSNSADVEGLNYVGGIVGYGKATGNFRTTKYQKVTNSGKITAKEDYAGGIAGYIATEGQDATSILDSSNTGNVTGRYYVGGIVGVGEAKGLKDDIIENCSNEATVTAEAYVGCIAGKLAGIKLVSCTNKNSVINATGSVIEENKKYAYVGGFAGYGWFAEDCTNEVSINYTEGGACVGGIFGRFDVSTIVFDEDEMLKNLTNNAEIRGGEYVGGIVGFAHQNWLDKSLIVEAAVNTADVHGNAFVGGIAGYLEGKSGLYMAQVFDSYSTGNISGESNTGEIAGQSVNVQFD